MSRGTAKTRKGAAQRMVRSMRELGLVELVDEPLVTELVVLAADLDAADHGGYVYPQLVRIYHEHEQRVAERLLPSRQGEGESEGQSLAERLAALGNEAD